MEKEKRDFIWKRGVLGVGLPVALLMSITAGFQVPGYLFRLQEFHPHTFLVAFFLFTPVFLGAGWLWGFLVYDAMKRRGR